MIHKSNQKWEPGQIVKVGFVANLVVKAAIPTPGDRAPDAYLLTNQAGNKVYEFVPHQGLRRIDVDEARELLEQAQRHASRVAALAAQRAAESAASASAIANLFEQVAA